MRLAFLGTPAFALPALGALAAAGHEIAAVYCQKPRPAGRGQQPRPCPVHRAALAAGYPVRTPERLRGNADEAAQFASLGLDVAVVVAYGLLLPPAFLASPREGCLNIHASLLPRWRGAAPIQAAILAGDAETGVSIMRMDEGLDTGPVLAEARVAIDETTTAAALHDRLAVLGAGLVVDVLAHPRPARPQPAEGALYAPKLTRADGRIDWTRPAAEIARRIRALNPWPGTFTEAGGQTLKLLAAAPAAAPPAGTGSGAPGEVLDDAGLIACGEGALRLERLQRPGRAALAAAEFLRGHPLRRGMRLGT